MADSGESPIGCWLRDPPSAMIGVGQDGRISFTAGVAEVLGYADEELLGRPVENVLTQRQALLAQSQARPNSSAPARFELPVRRKDGTQFVAELTASRVHTDTGPHVVATVRGAPESHRNEVNRNLLAVTADSSADAIIAVTPAGEITYWNRAAEALYGYQASEVIGSSIELLYVDDPGLEATRILNRISQGKQIRLDGVRRRHQDGTVRRVSDTVLPIVDESGDVVGAASICHDAMANQRADERFRALLEAAPVAIIGVAGDGQVLLVNAEAERLFGYPRDELVGQQVEVLVPDPVRGRHAGLRLGYLAHPQTRRMGAGLSLTGRRKDGSQFPIDVSLSAIERDNGILITAAIQDLTQQVERERLEEQLQQTRRLESLGQLAGGVAHDFNNLMAIIGGYAAFIIEDAQAVARGEAGNHATIVEEAERIQHAVARASRVTRQLLAFGRREVARRQVLDLNALVRESVTLLERTLGAHITINVDLPDPLPPILADRGHIEQVIVNAAVNARDAMPGGGSLTIDTGQMAVDEAYARQRGVAAGDYARLRISDNGTGMTKEVVAQAFEPFFTTKPPGEGTGLGLSTVYGIASEHGGRAAIYSEPGHGTTLTVLLPTVDTVAAEAGPARPAPVSAGGNGGARYTILVVDDEEGLRDVIKRILVRLGHQVLVAADGPQALVIADQAESIDLLITDVIMPKMLGKELADRLLAHLPKLRVLFMSGYAQPALSAQGTLDPGTVLLEKPFTEAELRDCLAAVFATSDASTDT
jgi:two-component system, cell cycle sensor histidine kinase and response regulator CckA